MSLHFHRRDHSVLGKINKLPPLVTPSEVGRVRHTTCTSLTRLWTRSSACGTSFRSSNPTRRSSCTRATVQSPLTRVPMCVSYDHSSSCGLTFGAGKHHGKARSHPLVLTHPRLGRARARRAYRAHRRPIREAAEQRHGEDWRSRGAQLQVRRFTFCASRLPIDLRGDNVNGCAT